MIEVSATLDHLLLGLLHAYKLRNIPVDVDDSEDGFLTVTFLVSLPQHLRYRRRIRGFGEELKKYVQHLYVVDVKTKRNQTWLTLI
jgi:hypothetical protein